MTKSKGNNPKRIIITEENMNDIFNKYFIPSVNRETIYLNGNNLVMEIDNDSIVVDFNMFGITFNRILEYLFENNLPKWINGGLDAKRMKILFDWNNPIFDEMRPTIIAREKVMDNLYDKLNPESESYSSRYAQKMKNATYAFLSSVPDSNNKKNDYIDFFYNLNVVESNDLIELGYFNNYSIKELSKMRKNGEISQEYFEGIVYSRIEYERTVEKSRKHQHTYNSKVIELASELPPRKIINMFLMDELNEEELARMRLIKDDLFALPYEDLISVLSNNRLPKNLRITSKDLINQYGRTIDGEKIYKLIKYGCIEPEDVIDIASINNVLRHTDFDEDMMFSDDEIMAFYTPEILISMKENKKITSDFLEKYFNFVDFENQIKIFNVKSQMLVKEIKRHMHSKENQLSEEEIENAIYDYILEFYNLGLCDAETTKNNMSDEYIEKLYIEEKISIEQIMKLHSEGIVNDNAFVEYYSDNELFDLYLEGQIKVLSLVNVQDRNALYDNILEALDNGKMPIEDIMILYFSLDVLNTQQLGEIIEFSEGEIDLISFINEETSFEKIKELFSNCIIDYASISILLRQGRITQEEFNEIKDTINSQEFFKALKGRKTFKIITSRKNDIKHHKSNHVIDPIHHEDVDEFRSEIDLVSRVIGIDLDTSDYSLIESYNINGRPTSLNNYRVYGNSENGIVVLRKSKKENALFIMNVAQMVYFLKGEENENGQIEIANKMKDKANLRSIEGVIPIEHDEFFARNVVEAACRISPEITETLKNENGEYLEDVSHMVIEMRNAYREKKGFRTLDED